MANTRKHHRRSWEDVEWKEGGKRWDPALAYASKTREYCWSREQERRVSDQEQERWTSSLQVFDRQKKPLQEARQQLPQQKESYCQESEQSVVSSSQEQPQLFRKAGKRIIAAFDRRKKPQRFEWWLRDTDVPKEASKGRGKIWRKCH